MGFLDLFFGPPNKDQFAKLYMAALRKAGDTRSMRYDVETFRIVFEQNGKNLGFSSLTNAYAEYVAAPENQLVLKPANVSFEAAAGATMAAMTAWQSLVNNGKVKKGDKVIVHGASGV